MWFWLEGPLVDGQDKELFSYPLQPGQIHPFLISGLVVQSWLDTAGQQLIVGPSPTVS